jgi:hypothetical protein
VCSPNGYIHRLAWVILGYATCRSLRDRLLSVQL